MRSLANFETAPQATRRHPDMGIPHDRARQETRSRISSINRNSLPPQSTMTYDTGDVVEPVELFVAI